MRQGEDESKESRRQAEGQVMRLPRGLKLAELGWSGRRFGLCVVLAAGLVAVLFAFSASAFAVTQGPVWKITGVSSPTNFKPGDQTGDDSVLIAVTNVGGRSSDGSPVTISDSLPSGLIPTEILANDSYKRPVGTPGVELYGGFGDVSCVLSPVPSCTVSAAVDPGDTVIVTLPVDVEPGLPASVMNTVMVSGGGVASASVSDSIAITSALPGYGVAPGGLAVATSTSQAAAHPNVTTSFFLNTINTLGGATQAGPVAPPKDISFDLPPGLVGTTVGMARCTMAGVIEQSHCPADTMVGTATVMLQVHGNGVNRTDLTVPVYNIAPAPGEPAAFAFNVVFFPVRLDTSVLSNGDYGVRVTAPDLTEGAQVIATSVTVWGVPADHNGPGPDIATQELGLGGVQNIVFGGPGVEQTRVPLLTNPSQCSTALEGTLLTDSWEAPGVFASASTSIGHDTGCELLPFDASVSMLPDTLQAGAPAGYSLDLHVPQNESPDGVATPDVKKVVATLPLGTVISPSAADGLGVCSSAQFFGSGPREEAPAKPGECPRESQVGTVRIKTPALEEPLTGDVYLGTPECNPCTPADAQDGRMIRLFVQVVGEGESGIVVKLEGKGQINQQTGQITTTFENDPQLPFSDFKLTLGGGERATLANPRACGAATTTLDLTPWSSPFTPDATPFSTFAVTGCYSPQFNPSFTAGTTNNQAGESSPFTLSFGRSDADEFLNGLQLKMPPGLLGMLSKVSLCGEPQASQGTCGPESLIGHTTVETGPGADPFLVTGGEVFITGPYKGAPYGLSIVVPAKAGPYTLSGTTGNGTVVVRSAINVDPTTSALTVTADPLPTVLDGIPLQLRLVNVTIDREGFTFNPTNCNKLAIAATITSTEAAAVGVSAPFQVTNCAALGFKPKFLVSTSGKTSKANGASLDAKVIYPAGVKLANIAKVKVDLPKQLPSRLTTLQKACTAATFEANPGSCPAASVIGIVKASTPVLPVGLTGPVYFVSHGGEAFPDLVIVLQGDGVRVNLTASTFISKAGITSSTFKTVPDVPISSFELYLPEGKYSALAANGNLCTSKLAMPTAFIAQNGAEIHQSTKISVTGCPKTKTKKKAKAKAKKARKSSSTRQIPSDRRANS
jgi:hypothetical protein